MCLQDKDLHLNSLLYFVMIPKFSEAHCGVCRKNVVHSILLFLGADQWHCHGEPITNRCQEADWEVEGQVEDGGAKRWPSHAAQHSRPRRQRRVSQQLRPRRWVSRHVAAPRRVQLALDGTSCERDFNGARACFSNMEKDVAMSQRWFLSLNANVYFILISQTFQKYILSLRTIPIDPLGAVVDRVRPTGLNRQTFSATHLGRSATAGKPTARAHLTASLVMGHSCHATVNNTYTHHSQRHTWCSNPWVGGCRVSTSHHNGIDQQMKSVHA